MKGLTRKAEEVQKKVKIKNKNKNKCIMKFIQAWNINYLYECL
jgi:hypothetical protein